MRYCLLLIFLTFAEAEILSQRVTVSPPRDLGQNTKYTILGKVQDVSLLFMEDRKKYELCAYDDKLNVLWDRSFEENPSVTRVSGILTQDKQVQFFYSIRKQDSTFLVHKTYNTTAESTDSTIILRSESRFNNPFLFTHSEDKTKVLFFNPTYRKKINVITYDLNKRDVLWENEFIFDENIDDEFQFIELTNSGEVFVVLDQDNSRFRKDKHAIEIFRYAGQDRVTKREIDFNDKLTYHLSGKYDNINERLVLGGYYSDKSLSDSEGVFMLTIDSHSSEVQSIFKRFQNNTLQNIYGQRNKKFTSLSDIEVADIILTQDGGAIILGEIRKEYQKRLNYSSSLSPGMSNSIDFYYEDILAYAISGDFKNKWTRVIHKRQFSQDDYAAFSSFFVFQVPSFLQLIFNDEISSNSTVSAFGINGNGDINRTNLMSTGLQDLRIIFDRAVQTSSNSFIVPSEYKGDLKLVLVEF